MSSAPTVSYEVTARPVDAKPIEQVKQKAYTLLLA